MKKATHVFLTTRSVGCHFGTIGQIRSSRTRRVLLEADAPSPYGFTAAALGAAQAIAIERGYIIDSSESDRWDGRH